MKIMQNVVGSSIDAGVDIVQVPLFFTSESIRNNLVLSTPQSNFENVLKITQKYEKSKRPHTGGGKLSNVHLF